MAQRRGEPGLDIGQIGSAAIDRDHPLARIEQDMPLGKMMPEPRRIGRGKVVIGAAPAPVAQGQGHALPAEPRAPERRSADRHRAR
jgi:chorismate-pyruvate lyase